MSTQPDPLPPLDLNSPTGRADGIAFRHQMMLLDVAMFNRARYERYALQCNSQAVGISAGRVDPNAKPYVPGQAGWPSMPHEVLVDKDAAGFEYVEQGQDGPRTLDQVDPVNFRVLIAPPDEHLSAIQKKALLPQGVIDLGAPEGDPASGIFDVGPNDTWPAGVKTPPMPDGHQYIKFSWAGLGYKYERV